MSNLPAITYIAVVELDVPWDENNPSWTRELADVALSADHRIEGMRVVSMKPKVTMTVAERKGADILLSAMKDPAAYWEERCARAEDRLAAAVALADEWIAQRDRAVENRSDTPAHHWRGKDGDAIRAALAEGGAS